MVYERIICTMKILSLFLAHLAFLLTFANPLYAQPAGSSEYVFVFPVIGTFRGVQDHQELLVPDNSLYQVFNNIDGERLRPRSQLLLGIKLKSERQMPKGMPVRYLSKWVSSYFIGDSSETEVLAMGIDESNRSEFRYRVVENDQKEIVPWSVIPQLDQSYGAKKPYALIGRFRSPGNQLFVEVKHVSDYSLRDGVIFDWRTADAPQLQQIAVFWRDSGKTRYGGLATTHFFQSIDPRTQIPRGFRFEQNAVSNIQLFLEDHYDIPYTAFIRRLSGRDSIPYKITSELFDKSFQIHEQHFSVPGKYELIINRSAGYGELVVSDALRIPFEVLPRSGIELSWTIEMVISLSVILLVVLVTAFVTYSRRQQRKLKQVAVEHQVAAFELKSLRNQLNPHFLFNALASIQNLIAKGMTEKANFYIGKFSALTRQLLEKSQEEMLSLQEEMDLVENYLLMEQLRFNFRFVISPQEGLEMDNIEIPTMLLQPLVENAAKHGVSALAEEGLIVVSLKVVGHDLLIEIEDNGPGFQDLQPGHGLRLTRQRIDVLNSLSADQTISLCLVCLHPGAKATVKFENWTL